MRFWLTAIVALVSVALVSCTHAKKSPTSAMMIRAIGPLGQSFYKQPIWRFAITNTGASDVCWMAWTQVQGASDKDYSNGGGHIDWPEGVFAPGQGLETNMIVPGKMGSVWRAYVEFWTISPQELQKSQSDAARFGESANRFCPHREDKKGIYYDEWQ